VHQSDELKSAWEIMVPVSDDRQVDTVKRWTNFTKFVMDVAGGFSAYPAIEGGWRDGEGRDHFDLNRPVKIICTAIEIRRVSDFVAKYYKQNCVMVSRLGDSVTFYYYDPNAGFKFVRKEGSDAGRAEW